MNRNGFTIVELIISVAILTIVMVFALNLLVVLNEKEINLDVDTNMVLNQAFVSKKINGDIIKNGGIKLLNCTTTYCNFTFNNDVTKKMSLINNKKTIKYENEDYVEFTRTLPEGSYGNIVAKEFLNYSMGTLRIITINLQDYPNYEIQILDY